MFDKLKLLQPKEKDDTWEALLGLYGVSRDLLSQTNLIEDGLLEGKIRDALHDCIKGIIDPSRLIAKEYLVEDKGKVDILIVNQAGDISCGFEMKRKLSGDHRLQLVRYPTNLMKTNPRTQAFPMLLFDGFEFQILIAGFDQNYRPYFYHCKEYFSMFMKTESG